MHEHPPPSPHPKKERIALCCLIVLRFRINECLLPRVCGCVYLGVGGWVYVIHPSERLYLVFSSNKHEKNQSKECVVMTEKYREIDVDMKAGVGLTKETKCNE